MGCTRRIALALAVAAWTFLANGCGSAVGRAGADADAGFNGVWDGVGATEDGLDCTDTLASSEDGVPDSTPQAHARPDNPLLGEWGGCEAPACDPGVDPYSELKAFWASHPCDPIPEDLACRWRASKQGVKWSNRVDELVKSVSVASDGFDAGQEDGLRCLGYMLPTYDEFRASPGTGRRIAETIEPFTRFDFGVDGIAAGQAFLERFGPMIGAIHHIGPEYSFNVKIEVSAMLEVWLRPKSYAGITFDPSGGYILLRFDHVTKPGTIGEECPGVYRLDKILSTLSREIEGVDLDPEHRISAGQAVAKSIEACGTGCSALSGADADAKPTRLLIDRSHLKWEVHLACPVTQVPDWMWTCTYHVDALSGEILWDGQDCCID